MPASSSPAGPGVDLREVAPRRQRAFDPRVLGVIALGGVAGSEARYALDLAWPAGDGAWPATTFWTNVVGSLLLGGLMVVVTELTSPHRLLRPFLGVGVLGGFTTFSTATIQVEELVVAGRAGVAIAYLFGTAVLALAAAAIGAGTLRAVAAGARRMRGRRTG